MKGIRSERSGHEDNGKVDPVQEIVYSRMERKARTMQILTKIGLMAPDVMPAIIMKIE